MKFFKLCSLLIVLAVFSLASCVQDYTTKHEARASLATTNSITTKAISPVNTNATEEAVTTGPLTVLSFDDLSFDFGEVKDGERVTHIFEFTNTGDEPLIISNAKGSCGCTVPDWPRKPIAAGHTGEIKVEFNTKGRGNVEGKLESKRVTITANTDPGNSFLTLKGKIFKDKEPA